MLRIGSAAGLAVPAAASGTALAAAVHANVGAAAACSVRATTMACGTSATARRGIVDLGALPMLTDDQTELRDGVRRWAQEVVAPMAAEIDRSNEFPMWLWKEMGGMGLLGVTAPAEFGGLALGYTEHCLVAEEVARASASVCLSYGAHSNLCVNQLTLNGTQAQKQAYLPALIAGDHVGALAMSETGAGSDVMNLQCQARREGDDGDYILNGSKYWITNGPDADVVVIYARTKDAGPRGITAFIVESAWDGFSTGPKLDKVGMRGSNTGELILDNVRVPAANVLGGENNGAAVLFSGLDLERLVLSGLPVGIMAAALDVAVPYVRERHQFGQPIGEFQLVQGKVADMFAALSSSRAHLYSAAAAVDAGRVAGMRVEIGAMILYVAEAATRVALDSVQLLGGNGYTNEYPAGRLMRDAKLVEIGAGTSEIRRWLVGREIVKGAID